MEPQQSTLVFRENRREPCFTSLGLIELAINQVLFARDLFPRRDYRKTKWQGHIIWMCRRRSEKKYISRFFDFVDSIVDLKQRVKVALVIYDKCTGAVLEEYFFLVNGKEHEIIRQQRLLNICRKILATSNRDDDYDCDSDTELDGDITIGYELQVRSRVPICIPEFKKGAEWMVALHDEESVDGKIEEEENGLYYKKTYAYGLQKPTTYHTMHLFKKSGNGINKGLQLTDRQGNVLPEKPYEDIEESNKKNSIKLVQQPEMKGLKVLVESDDNDNSLPGETLEYEDEIIEQEDEKSEQWEDEAFEQGEDESLEQGEDVAFEQGEDEEFEQGEDEAFDQGEDESVEQGEDEAFEQGENEALEPGEDEALEQENEQWEDIESDEELWEDVESDDEQWEDMQSEDEQWKDMQSEDEQRNDMQSEDEQWKDMQSEDEQRNDMQSEDEQWEDETLEQKEETLVQGDEDVEQGKEEALALLEEETYMEYDYKALRQWEREQLERNGMTLIQGEDRAFVQGEDKSLEQEKNKMLKQGGYKTKKIKSNFQTLKEKRSKRFERLGLKREKFKKRKIEELKERKVKKFLSTKEVEDSVDETVEEMENEFPRNINQELHETKKAEDRSFEQGEDKTLEQEKYKMFKLGEYETKEIKSNFETVKEKRSKRLERLGLMREKFEKRKVEELKERKVNFLSTKEVEDSVAETVEEMENGFLRNLNQELHETKKVEDPAYEKSPQELNYEEPKVFLKCDEAKKLLNIEKSAVKITNKKSKVALEFEIIKTSQETTYEKVFQIYENSKKLLKENLLLKAKVVEESFKIEKTEGLPLYQDNKKSLMVGREESIGNLMNELLYTENKDEFLISEKAKEFMMASVMKESLGKTLKTKCEEELQHADNAEQLRKCEYIFNDMDEPLKSKGVTKDLLKIENPDKLVNLSKIKKFQKSEDSEERFSVRLNKPLQLGKKEAVHPLKVETVFESLKEFGEKQTEDSPNSQTMNALTADESFKSEKNERLPEESVKMKRDEEISNLGVSLMPIKVADLLKRLAVKKPPRSMKAGEIVELIETKEELPVKKTALELFQMKGAFGGH